MRAKVHKVDIARAREGRGNLAKPSIAAAMVTQRARGVVYINKIHITRARGVVLIDANISAARARVCGVFRFGASRERGSKPMKTYDLSQRA